MAIISSVATIRVHRLWAGGFPRDHIPFRFYTIIDQTGAATVLHSRDGSTVYEMTTGTNEFEPVFGRWNIPFEEPFTRRGGRLFMGFDDPSKNSVFEQPGDIVFGSRRYRPTGETLQSLETTDWPTERIPVYFGLAPDGRYVYVSDYAGDYHSLRLFIGESTSMAPLAHPYTKAKHGYVHIYQYDPEELDVVVFTDGRRPGTFNRQPMKPINVDDFTFTETRDTVTFAAT